MDSAQLYLELLKSGERIMVALADEREASVFSAVILSYANCQDRLASARHEVERAAQRYAVALRAYLVTILSELAPLEPAQSRGRRRIVKHRERTGAAPAACGNGSVNGNALKDVAAEGFPVSTRLLRVQ
jgi:hypothetical protein